MSKKQSISINSEHSDGDVYEVEKIINYKIIDGKRLYKVIWTGYSFQEATWEPEENLKCPDKINQFFKRYQDVIKRKNLLKKYANTISAQSLEKSKAAEPQKPIIEKTQSLQKPQIVNKQSFVSKEKFQGSIQKSSVINEKRIPDIENLKQKIMRPSPSTDKQITVTNEIRTFPIKISNTQIAIQNLEGVEDNSPVTKVIKIQSLPQVKSDNLSNRIAMKFEQKLQTNFNQSHNVKSRKNEKNYHDDHSVIQILQESKINSQQNESSESTEESSLSRLKQQGIFLNFGERLDIQKILCPMEIQNQQNEDQQDTERQGRRTHQYFLIKNKFSQNQKIVERERIINEQPMKLIEYYEALMIK